MTPDTEHSHGFYLIALNRIQRDIKTNRAAHRRTNQNHDTHFALLQLINKYKSHNNKNNMTKLITHDQTVSRNLDLELSILQSDFDSLNAHIQNNNDIAGHAYNNAYLVTKAFTTPQNHRTFFEKIAKFFAPRTR